MPPPWPAGTTSPVSQTVSLIYQNNPKTELDPIYHKAQPITAYIENNLSESLSLGKIANALSLGEFLSITFPVVKVSMLKHNSIFCFFWHGKMIAFQLFFTNLRILLDLHVSVDIQPWFNQRNTSKAYLSVNKEILPAI